MLAANITTEKLACRTTVVTDVVKLKGKVVTNEANLIENLKMDAMGDALDSCTNETKCKEDAKKV